MNMSEILSCDSQQCSFNSAGACRAGAVTIGVALAAVDQVRPVCETFVVTSQKGGIAGTAGKVGACKEQHCEFNNRLVCTASSIRIGFAYKIACCRTFTPRT